MNQYSCAYRVEEISVDVRELIHGGGPGGYGGLLRYGLDLKGYYSDFGHITDPLKLKLTIFPSGMLPKEHGAGSVSNNY